MGRWPGCEPPDLGVCRGGIMSIKRTVIAPLVLMLGAAIAILAGALAPVVAAATTGAAAGVSATASSPHYIYMG